ncbi:MAG: hypothetical protein AAFY15_04530, partial [Cyanobacteria bacterium J06648_11]
NRERAGTIDEIHAATGLPKRSLYVVLSRLHADEVVSKSGDRRQIVYKFCGRPLHRREGDGENATDSTSSREIPNEAQVNSDRVVDSPRGEKVVRSNAKQTSIPLCEGDTASQHSSNNLLTSPDLLDEMDSCGAHHCQSHPSIPP